ncbi:hypothetical protein DNTS_012397, partial [Danionella cerebrum]
QPCHSKTSHIVEGHREHQDPELPFLDSSSSKDPTDPPVLQVSGDSSLVSSPVISPDPSVIISDSGIISEIDSAVTSRADDEKDSSWFSAEEEFIESSVSSAAGYSPDTDIPAAAHTGTKAYCPPEYFEKKEYHAFPATVYSLGILMFILLHGRFPTPDDLYYIENDWSTYMFSEECCHLMWSCLRSDPEQRIPFEQIYSHNWFLVGSADQAHYFYQEDIIQEA